MSREIVACVASKPRCCSRRRSSSWLCSDFAIDQLENQSLAARFHDRVFRLSEYTNRMRDIGIIYASISIDPIALCCV